VLACLRRRIADDARTAAAVLVTVGLGEFVDGYELVVISGAVLRPQPGFHLDKSVGWIAERRRLLVFGSAVGAFRW
jgi:hypothetical protein